MGDGVAVVFRVLELAVDRAGAGLPGGCELFEEADDGDQLGGAVGPGGGEGGRARIRFLDVGVERPAPGGGAERIEGGGGSRRNGSSSTASPRRWRGSSESKCVTCTTCLLRA